MGQIEEFKTNGSKIINIKGYILRGHLTLQIESVWQVNYESEQIHLIAAFLWTPSEKSPLHPDDVPDRHKRAVRRIGSTVFDKKRFDGLVLFEMTDPSVIYSISKDKEQQMFTEVKDARLWLLVTNGEGAVEKHTNPEKRLKHSAKINSTEIRNHILTSMIRATKGIEAIDRIRVWIERGYEPSELERIWRLAHGNDTIPETLRSIIYGEKAKTKT